MGRKGKGHPGGWPLSRGRSGSGDLGDVLGRRTLVALDDVELDPLALGEALEAAALDRRVMNEQILAAILRRDESEALGVVEPLHFTRVTHSSFLSFLWPQNRKRPDWAPGLFRNFLAVVRQQSHSLTPLT